MKVSDEELIEVLRNLRRAYPEWRLGQMVCNIATWARGPIPGATWDVEDEEFLKTAREHLRKRKFQ